MPKFRDNVTKILKCRIFNPKYTTFGMLMFKNSIVHIFGNVCIIIVVIKCFFSKNVFHMKEESINRNQWKLHKMITHVFKCKSVHLSHHTLIGCVIIIAILTNTQYNLKEETKICQKCKIVAMTKCKVNKCTLF